ncbi:hypothetical protein VTG60DRAFT_1081 [Thermothelomyces hinnuleus]
MLCSGYFSVAPFVLFLYHSSFSGACFFFFCRREPRGTGCWLSQLALSAAAKQVIKLIPLSVVWLLRGEGPEHRRPSVVPSTRFLFFCFLFLLRQTSGHDCKAELAGVSVVWCLSCSALLSTECLIPGMNQNSVWVFVCPDDYVDVGVVKWFGSRGA